MRAAFVRALVELAGRDPSILLLSGDLGFMALEPFSDAFPSRFFNVGVAEQNMIGLATGLAESGFLPYAYSIVTFAALRPYEFIRDGPVHHRLPVRIVGVGGGYEYGPAGPSHHGLEDIAVLRVQPGLSVFAPADHEQARSAFLATWDLPGPVYYGIGKDDRTTVPGLGGRFRPGRAERVREGEDVLFVSTGSVTIEAVRAADALAARGVRAGLLVVASVAPAPADDLAEALSRVPVALTVEAHYTTGGLGSLVSEVVAERGLPCRIVRCGVRSGPDGLSGSTSWLLAKHGLSAAALQATALAVMEGRA